MRQDKHIYNRVLGDNTQFEEMLDSESGYGVWGWHGTVVPLQKGGSVAAEWSYRAHGFSHLRT